MLKNLFKKKVSFLCFLSGIFIMTLVNGPLRAQNAQLSDRKITGTVVDSTNNQPIPGISIVIKGTVTGGLTDINGKFEITAKSTDVLVFSYVGYSSQEVLVGANTVFGIKLAVQSELLEGVVVMGYGTQKKSHLTGSVSKISANGLEQIPVSRADEALIGKVSGVTIQTTDAKVGASPTIRVRGVGSITADASPLVVMDGVVVSSSYLGSIDMNDVESIEVLKDAASASIYGSRGGNGIIMITTKQGKAGKTKFSFNTYYGSKFTADYQTVPSIADWTKSTEDYYGGMTDEAKYINLLGIETNWADVMFDGGNIQSYSLSALGGNDKTKFAASGSYMSDDGVLITDSYKKMNFRLNVDTKVNKTIEFGGNIYASYTSQREFPIGIHDAVRQSPWLPTYLDENNFQYVNKTKYPLVQIGDYAYEVYFDGYVLPGNTTGTTISSTTNESALAKVLERENYYYNFKLFSNTYLKLNMAKGLSFKTSIAADYDNLQTERWVGTKLLAGPAGSSSTYNTNTNTHLVNENIFTYDKEARKHSFGAVTGFAMEKWFYYSSGETGTGYKFDYIHTLNAASTIASATTKKEEELLASFLGRLNYAYNEKYLLSVSARYDGSSRFGKDNKFGFFPAASVGWRVSQEDFLKGNQYISNLKARFSYGVTGNNSGIGRYGSIARLSPVTGVINGSAISGYNPANIENPELRWEKSVEIGPGIDLGLLKNRITLSLDYYIRSSKDLLLDQEIPSVTGFTVTTVNIGEVKNSGIELELTGNIISSNDFNWNVSGNLSHNTNELVDFAGANGLISYVDVKRPAEYIALEGNPISSFYGYIYEKDVPNEYLKKPLYPIGGTSQDCYVKDISGPNGVPDGIITSDDRTILGSPYPSLVWGFTNQFNYRDFDLSFTFQGSHGAKVRNMDPQYIENQFSSNMDYIATFPDKALVREKIYTDKIVQDASYVSLRSVNLGYTLPQKTVNRIGMSKVRIYASGQNLIYLMGNSYTSFNPEGVTDSSSPLRGGYQVGAAPIAKAVTVGINLEF
jgi:TonB-linked SusC/RagA family outer membrane protein